MSHKVRTTINPDVELEVDDAEYADLVGQGLVIEGKNKAPEPVPTVAVETAGKGK